MAHMIVTFVQDSSRASHQSCAAAVALSRAAMCCDLWSDESLAPDLSCAACRHALAPPLPAASDGVAPPVCRTLCHAAQRHEWSPSV
jgi:hypothetical protein